MVVNSHTERTYFYERWRAVFAGILETAGSTFLLLIAVRWFKAGAGAKALVAASGSVGLLISPLVVAWVGAWGITVARAASGLAAVGAACFLIMALIPVLPVFVLGSIGSMAAGAAAIPLLTQMYQENYPEQIRGRLFSRTIMIRIAVAAGFSELAGGLFSDRLDQFHWLLLIFAGAFAMSGLCLWRCPSRPLSITHDSPEDNGPARRPPASRWLTFFARTHPMRTWRWVYADRLFRNTLVCWMLMGFANLMMFPMRVEYLANPRYGLALSVSLIALFTGVIPNIARLMVSPIWGWLFDHVNFFALRVVLNMGFALGIVTFFMSQDMRGLVLGAVIFGLSNAGGDVAWGLWVTKFAPPDRVADYMAVHTFLTGVRGAIAPLVAFNLIANPSMTMGRLGWISAGLIFVSTLLLLPEVRFGRNVRPVAALVEEVSE